MIEIGVAVGAMAFVTLISCILTLKAWKQNQKLMNDMAAALMARTPAEFADAVNEMEKTPKHLADQEKRDNELALLAHTEEISGFAVT